jgi:hypothetical protein
MPCDIDGMHGIALMQAIMLGCQAANSAITAVAVDALKRRDTRVHMKPKLYVRPVVRQDRLAHSHTRSARTQLGTILTHAVVLIGSLALWHAAMPACMYAMQGMDGIPLGFVSRFRRYSRQRWPPASYSSSWAYSFSSSG